MTDGKVRRRSVSGGGGQRLYIGDEVEIFWPDDQAWYCGCVAALDMESGKAHIAYDDGEKEVLDMSLEVWRPTYAASYQERVSERPKASSKHAAADSNSQPTTRRPMAHDAGGLLSTGDEITPLLQETVGDKTAMKKMVQAGTNSQATTRGRIQHDAGGLLSTADEIMPLVQDAVGDKTVEKEKVQMPASSTGGADGSGGGSGGHSGTLTGDESKVEEFARQVVHMMAQMKRADDVLFARIDKTLTSLEKAFSRR